MIRIRRRKINLNCMATWWGKLRCVAAGGERTSLKNKMERTFAEAGGACVIGYEVNLVGVAATRRFHVEGFILVGLWPNNTTSSTIVRTHKPHFTRIRIHIHKFLHPLSCWNLFFAQQRNPTSECPWPRPWRFHHPLSRAFSGPIAWVSCRGTWRDQRSGLSFFAIKRVSSVSGSW